MHQDLAAVPSRTPHLTNALDGKSLPSLTAAGPIRWGALRATATYEHPNVAWYVLTDPQADALFLSLHGISQRGVAMLYRVSQPAIAKHIRKARERLSTTPTPTPPPEAPASARLCDACDTPRLPCCDCVARLMAARPDHRQVITVDLLE